MQRLISVNRNTTDGKYNKRQMINQTRHSCYQIESVLKFCAIASPSKVHSFYDATTKNAIFLKSFSTKMHVFVLIMYHRGSAIVRRNLEHASNR